MFREKVERNASTMKRVQFNNDNKWFFLSLIKKYIHYMNIICTKIRNELNYLLIQEVGMTQLTYLRIELYRYVQC